MRTGKLGVGRGMCVRACASCMRRAEWWWMRILAGGRRKWMGGGTLLFEGMGRRRMRTDSVRGRGSLLRNYGVKLWELMPLGQRWKQRNEHKLVSYSLAY